MDLIARQLEFPARAASENYSDSMVQGINAPPSSFIMH
jgi:hypothetical protein